MRSMAVVNTISAVEAIPGKDNIVLVRFRENDWSIIGQKSECSEGSLVVRVEVDSLLPIRPEFEFLRKRCYSQKFDRFKIGTMKMAGVISQGILFPLSILPEGKTYKAGDDVTEELDIVKLEDAEDASPKPGSGEDKIKTQFVRFCLGKKSLRWLGRLIIKYRTRNRVSDNFPSEYISKTDETILQNYKGLLEKWADAEAYFSLKCEGCVTGDTLVMTEFGEKPIEQLYNENYKGMILSFNPETRESEYKNCLGFSKKRSTKETQWFLVETADGKRLTITGTDRVCRGSGDN